MEIGRWRCAVAGLLLAGLSSAAGVSWQRTRDSRVILRMQAQHVEHQQQRMAQDGALRLERSQRATALLTSEGHEYDALALGILAALPPSADEAVPLPLQQGLIHAARAVTRSHRLAQSSKELTSLDISPDGTQILSATGQGLAEIWDSQTGQTVGTLSLQNEAITTALFAPDGKSIATLSHGGFVHFWNAQSRQPKQIGGGPQDRFHAIAMAASGRLACAGSDHKIHFLDLQTGMGPATSARHSYAIRSLRFSADGQRLVSTSDDGTARIWDTTRGQELAVLRWQDLRYVPPNEKGEHLYIHSADFSPDGREVATASSDGIVRFWWLHDPREPVRQIKHPAAVRVVRYSKDGSLLLTAAADSRARIWDAHSGERIQTLSGHQAWIRQVDTIAQPVQREPVPPTVPIADPAARLSLRGGSYYRAQEGRAGGPSSVHLALFSPDGRWILTSASDRSTRRWELSPSSLPLSRFSTSANNAPMLTVPDRSGPPRMVLLPSPRYISGACFSPDGASLFTGSQEGSVAMWHPARGDEEELFRPGGPIDGLACSRDGHTLFVSFSNGKAQLWDVPNRRPLRTLYGHENSVQAAAFSLDGTQLLTGSDDGRVRTWDVRSGRLLDVLRNGAGQSLAVALSPDRSLLAFGGYDGRAYLWNRTQAREPLPAIEHRGRVLGLTFSNDGRKLVTSSADGIVRFFDAATGALELQLPTQLGNVIALSFSEDGTNLWLAGSDDNRISAQHIAVGLQPLLAHACAPLTAMSLDEIPAEHPPELRQAHALCTARKKATP